MSKVCSSNSLPLISFTFALAKVKSAWQDLHYTLFSKRTHACKPIAVVLCCRQCKPCHMCGKFKLLLSAELAGSLSSQGTPASPLP